MEIKYLVVFTVLGLASGFTLPNQMGDKADLESSFSAHGGPAMSNTRDKRHLLFKKYKKAGSSYQQSSSVEGHGTTRREVHHHHHYSYPAPPTGQFVERHYVESQPAPSYGYHHYHGGYSGGFSTQGGYNNGGYVAGGGSYYSKPSYEYPSYVYAQPPPPPPSGPVVATPVATSHNAVDRGQGAAAVNNIAIIHARAGSSSGTALDESKALPNSLPFDLDSITGEAIAHHYDQY